MTAASTIFVPGGSAPTGGKVSAVESTVALPGFVDTAPVSAPRGGDVGLGSATTGAVVSTGTMTSGLGLCKGPPGVAANLSSRMDSKIRRRSRDNLLHS